MLEINKSKFFWKTKEIWFAEKPFDVEGCDSLSFYCCKDRFDVPGFLMTESLTLVLNLTRSLDEIFDNMNKDCKIAAKQGGGMGISVKINQNYEEFYEMYGSVMEKKKIKGRVKFEDIVKSATIFVAEFEGEVLSGHAFLEDKENIRSWIAASKRFEGDSKYKRMVSNASKLIVWEAIKYAKSKGIKEFDFGGYYEDGLDKEKISISNFKKSFGGEIAKRYTYNKYYSMLYKIMFLLKNKQKYGKQK